jgi:hypothetical protein
MNLAQLNDLKRSYEYDVANGYTLTKEDTLRL